MTMHVPIITTEASWERSALRQQRDDTALRLVVRGHRRPDPAAARAPIDIAFVLDRSGSMSGTTIELAKQALMSAIDLMGSEDRVSLVIFDHETEVIQPLAPATPAVRAIIRQRLEFVTARGSTALSDGWLTGCQQLAQAGLAPGQRLQRAILLTDGQANQGITIPSTLAHHAAELWTRGISTTTMGFGEHYDEVLLSSMAEAGGGNFGHIRDASQFAGFFAREIGGLTMLAALHPQLELTMPRGLRAWLLNRFPTCRSGKVITVDLRDLVDGDEIDLVFRVTHRGNIDASSQLVQAQVVAIDPLIREQVKITVAIPPLAFVSDTQADQAPVDHLVTMARAREEAIAEQREALRLDREGRHQESRMAFARSSAVLADADATAARSGYAGLDDETLRAFRADLADASALAAAPSMPLDEETRKSRTARHAHRSRGGYTES